MKRTSIALMALAILTTAAHAQQPVAGTTASAAAVLPDPAFVSQMAIAGLVEVQLGKIATQQGSDPNVKAFGQMMIKDHELANTELAQVASRLGLALPKEIDQKHRTLIDRLSNLQDMELDRQYMAAMVEGHEEVAGLLRTRTEPAAAAGAAGQQAITQWAAKTLPVVQQHLQQARDLQQKIGK